MSYFKNYFIFIILCLTLVGCTSKNATVTKVDEECVDTYKLESEETHDGSAFISVTHESNIINKFQLCYEFYLTDEYLDDLRVDSQEEAGKLLERIFYEYSTPELTELQKIEGVEVEVSFPRNRVWRLMITINPKITDFKKISQAVGDGNLEMLEDVGKLSPRDYATMLNILGFKKLTK